MTDTRPENCRFCLQDEGKSYPRSSCTACGKTIVTGLGKKCNRISNHIPLDIPAKLSVDFNELQKYARVWFFDNTGGRCKETDEWEFVEVMPIRDSMTVNHMRFTQDDRHQLSVLIYVLRAAYTLGVKEAQQHIRNAIGM